MNKYDCALSLLTIMHGDIDVAFWSLMKCIRIMVKHTHESARSLLSVMYSTIYVYHDLLVEKHCVWLW